MKVGLLFPLSNTYPGIGQDFMDGFNSLLKKEGINDIILLKEGIGLGGVEKEVYQKAEKLLFSDDVDVLVAYADEKVLPVLYPLALATGKIILAVNPGANYPINWIAQPTVVHINLQHVFLCWLTGKEAAATGNGKAALATTYYDCGYLHSAAMVQHFMDSGGAIQHNYINNTAYDESFGINTLNDFLYSSPDCNNLLCVADTVPGGLFYRLLTPVAEDRSLHLFVSPMMLEAKAASAIANPAPYNVNGYLPWYASLATAANENFIQACNRPAGIFSLLGWETALVIQRLLQYENISDGEGAVGYLQEKPLQSPRGILQLDAATLHYLAPAAKYSLKAGDAAPTIEWITNLQQEWQAFIALPAEGAVTGWTNTYLCY